MGAREGRGDGSERAAGAEGPGSDGPAPRSGDAPAPAGPDPDPGAAAPRSAADGDEAQGVLTDEDLLAGALAARLQGAEAGPFRTWRPGQDPVPVPVLARPEDAPAAARDGDGDASSAIAREPPRPARGADPLDRFFYRADEGGLDLPGMSAAEVEDAFGAAAVVERDEYLLFRLDAEEYAVAIRGVREVIKAPAITEVPRAPAGTLGVITVRGEVVAVLDPRRRLGLPPASEAGARVMVVRAPDGARGLLVDGVSGVVRLPHGALEPCPQGLGGASEGLLAGIGRDRDRLFTVVDLGALLRRAPAQGEGRAHAGRA